MAILYASDLCACHRSLCHTSRRWLLGDFGFSSILKEGSMTHSEHRRGTSAYRAPELLDFSFDASGRTEPGFVTRQCDIWAIGCIIFNVSVTGSSEAFANDDRIFAFSKGYEGHIIPRLDERCNPALGLKVRGVGKDRLVPFWEHINSILEICFERDPVRRGTATDLKKKFEGLTIALQSPQIDPTRIWSLVGIGRRMDVLGSDLRIGPGEFPVCQYVTSQEIYLFRCWVSSIY